MTDAELAAMTGQSSVQGSPKLVLNEVLINGDPDAGFYRKRLWVDKGEGKPEEEDLGKNLNVIFLKIRRKLVERSKKGEIVRTTNEHNTVQDTVTVYEEGKEVFSGNAKEARTRFEGMRTVQVVYALLIHPTKEPELVRLTVKGASLGSEAKAKETMDFYQYVSTFENEPILNYITQLGVVREEGVKPYYCMTFARGPKVEKLLPAAMEKLQEVHTYTEKTAKAAPVPAAAVPAMDDFAEYEATTDEPNPGDIPF